MTASDFFRAESLQADKKPATSETLERFAFKFSRQLKGRLITELAARCLANDLERRGKRLTLAS